MEPSFSHRTSTGLLNSYFSSAERFLRSLSTERSLPNQENRKALDTSVVNIARLASRWPFFNVAVLFYGDMTEKEEDCLWNIAQLYLAAFSGVVTGGINRIKLTKWLRTNSWQKVEAYQTAWENFNRNIYEKRKSTQPNLLLVQMMRAAETGKISHIHVTGSIAESLFANLDGVTQVISATAVLLADSKETKEALNEEFNQNRGNILAYLGKKNTLLHFCMLEALRLQPVLAFSFPENSSKEKVIGGYIIPANMSVVVDTYAINVRNSFWGVDSQQYRPYRFATIRPSDLRYNLFTFGYGHRKCLGQHVAEKMIHCLIFHLFNQYDINVLPNQSMHGSFKADKSSWIGLLDVDLEMRSKS
jgi:gliotoxin/aspirochlorine/mycotoxins biosynthesis cytochrome P450 monooxygenase